MRALSVVIMLGVLAWAGAGEMLAGTFGSVFYRAHVIDQATGAD